MSVTKESRRKGTETKVFKKVTRTFRIQETQPWDKIKGHKKSRSGIIILRIQESGESKDDTGQDKSCIYR